MDVVATLRTELAPEAVHTVVADLASYPSWLDIVAKAVAIPADGVDSAPAWSIDLRGQLGPLRRSKRLRMERTIDEAPGRVRFERREHDGRQHSAWVMEARIVPDGADTVLTMSLHYGGSLWVPMLDRLLRDEIERSKPRLVARVAATT